MNAKKRIAAAVLAVSSLLAAVPATAASLSLEFGVQPGFHGGGFHWGQRDRGIRNRELSPQEIRRVLRDKGFRNIDYLDRRGAVYQVKATSRRGNRVGLVVNARNGEILNRYRY